MRLQWTSATDHIGSAWTRKWEGPYRIMEQRGPLTFRILQLHGRKEARVHAQDLKHFVYPADVVPPGNITMNEREPGAGDAEDEEAKEDDPEAMRSDDDEDEQMPAAAARDDRSDDEDEVPLAERQRRQKLAKRQQLDVAGPPEDLPPLEEERPDEAVDWQPAPPPE